MAEGGRQGSEGEVAVVPRSVGLPAVGQRPPGYRSSPTQAHVIPVITYDGKITAASFETKIEMLIDNQIFGELHGEWDTGVFPLFYNETKQVRLTSDGGEQSLGVQLQSGVCLPGGHPETEADWPVPREGQGHPRGDVCPPRHLGLLLAGG